MRLESTKFAATKLGYIGATKNDCSMEQNENYELKICQCWRVVHQSATFAVRKNYMNFSLRKKNVRKNRKKLMVGLNEEKNHLIYSRIILVVVVKN